MDDWNEQYENWVHDAAKKWDAMLPDRPAFHDLPVEYELPVVETYETQMSKKDWWKRGTIKLLHLNGKWSFCLDIYGETWGHSYGPWPQFCPPYPSKALALQAAIDKVIEYVEEHRRTFEYGRKKPTGEFLLTWVKGLRQVQLDLFA